MLHRFRGNLKKWRSVWRDGVRPDGLHPFDRPWGLKSVAQEEKERDDLCYEAAMFAGLAKHLKKRKSK